MNAFVLAVRDVARTSASGRTTVERVRREGTWRALAVEIEAFHRRLGGALQAAALELCNAPDDPEVLEPAIVVLNSAEILRRTLGREVEDAWRRAAREGLGRA